MQAKDISVGGRFRLDQYRAVYTRVIPDFLLPSMAVWSSTRVWQTASACRTAISLPSIVATGLSPSTPITAC